MNYREHFNELFSLAEQDSKKRLESVQKKFLEIFDCNSSLTDKYKNDYIEVLEWMLRLHRANSTTFYSLFKGVMSDTDLKTLEGMEELRSFIGNFFDDSGCELIVDPPTKVKCLNVEVERVLDPCPFLDWHIVWARDDKEWLSKNKLIDIMKQVYQADYEWAEKFRGHFGDDRTTKESLFDLEYVTQKCGDKNE